MGGKYSFSHRYDTKGSSRQLLKLLGFLRIPTGSPLAKILTGLFDFLYNYIPDIYTIDEIYTKEDRLVFKKVFQPLLSRLGGVLVFTRGDHDLTVAFLKYILNELTKVTEEFKKTKEIKDYTKLAEALKKLNERIGELEKKALFTVRHLSDLMFLANTFQFGIGRDRAITLILEGKISEERLKKAKQLVAKIKAEGNRFSKKLSKFLDVGGSGFGYKRMRDPSDLPYLHPYHRTLLATKLGKILLSKREMLVRYGYVFKGGKGIDPPSKLCVIIDRSGSTSGVLDDLIACAIAICNGVRKRFSRDTKIILFDTNVYDISDMNSERALEVLLSTVSGGGTDIAKAVDYANEKYKDYWKVLITDGGDNPIEEGKVHKAIIYTEGYWNMWKDLDFTVLARDFDELREILTTLVLTRKSKL